MATVTAMAKARRQLKEKDRRRGGGETWSLLNNSRGIVFFFFRFCCFVSCQTTIMSWLLYIFNLDLGLQLNWLQRGKRRQVNSPKGAAYTQRTRLRNLFWQRQSIEHFDTQLAGSYCKGGGMKHMWFPLYHPSPHPTHSHTHHKQTHSIYIRQRNLDTCFVLEPQIVIHFRSWADRGAEGEGRCAAGQ